MSSAKRPRGTLMGEGVADPLVLPGKAPRVLAFHGFTGTPQEVALQDVYKSVSMNKKVGIPITGVIENESYFVCDGCDKRHELFGSGGGQAVADFAEAPLLGQIPLDPSVREWGDAGTPVVQAAPSSAIALAFVEVAERLAGRVTAQNVEREGASLVIDRSGGKNRHLPISR